MRWVGPVVSNLGTYAYCVVDRFRRKRVIIGPDVVRCAALASLLFGPTSLVHVTVVASVLGGLIARIATSAACRAR